MNATARAGLGLLLIPLTLASIGLFTACASTPPPNEQLAVGRAAVERATGSAAAEAPAEMAVARDVVTSAHCRPSP